MVRWTNVRPISPDLQEQPARGRHPTAEYRQPFLVHCGDCAHAWTLLHLPITVEMFAKFGTARCPICASKRIYAGEKPLTLA